MQELPTDIPNEVAPVRQKLVLSRRLQIISGLSLIGVLVVSSAVFIKKITSKDAYTRTRSQAASDLINTGSYLPVFDASQQEIIQTYTALKNLIPVERPLFKLGFDYSTNTFLVTLYPPSYEISKQNFISWLAENNFSALPAEYFTYLLSTSTPTPTPQPTATPTSAPSSTPISTSTPKPTPTPIIKKIKPIIIPIDPQPTLSIN